MKSGILTVSSLIIFCAGLLVPSQDVLAGSSPQSESASQKMILEAMPFPSLPASIRSGFVGNSREALLVAGEDPQNPDANLKIWFTTKTGLGSQWKEATEHAPRWSAAAQWKDFLICAGGIDAKKPLAQVKSFSLDAEGALEASDLPPLPKPLAGAGAAVIRDRLYVIGGISSLENRVFENALWSLDLINPESGWRSETPLPGAPRAFAAVTQQYENLCVVGGLSSATGTDGHPHAISENWIFHPKAPEGSSRMGWTRQEDCPRPLAGAAAFPVGQACIAIMGGASSPKASLFPEDSEAQTNSHPLLFHVITDAWCSFDQPQNITFARVTTLGSGLTSKSIVLSNTQGGSETKASEFQIIRTARSLKLLDYIVIAGYFCFIALIGYFASRKHGKSSADFSLAGRNVPWWVAGISMFATGASALSMMSAPALAFASNLVFLFPVVILFVSYFVQSRLIFPLLRRMEITSTYEYLERRFNRTLRLIASAQCILFQTFGRASVVLLLPSLAISVTTGIDTWKSVLLMGCITTLYTALGGFNAVVWTDVFQGILKFFAPLFMIALCLFSLPGGPKEFIDIGLSHHKFDFALLTWDATLPALWILLLSNFLASTISQAGDQPTIQRVFSSPTKEVRRVAAMSTACGILISIVVNVLGVSIYAYFHAFPGKLDPLAQNDKIMPLFVIQALPTGFVGMVIAAIFASAMTTVASSMNSSATVFTEDFFMRFKPDASDKLRLKVLRITSYIVGIIAICMALLLSKQNTKSFMQVWSIISALLGGGIVGVYSLGMFTKRANGFGAVCGVVASVIITALVVFTTPLHWQTLLPIAILSCMIFGYFFSFFSHHNKPLDGLTVFQSSNNSADPSGTN